MGGGALDLFLLLFPLFGCLESSGIEKKKRRTDSLLALFLGFQKVGGQLKIK